VIVPAMQVVAKSIAAVAVMLLLCFIDPLLAVLTGIVLGGSYSLTYLATRRQQRLIGRQRLAANKDRFEILAEVFGGIKEIKLLGREEEIVRRFEAPSYRFAISAVRNAIAAQLPRFGLEAIAFGGIVLMVLYLLGTGQRFQEILPILGLYAFAGYRLMPALQQIFLAVTTIRFNVAALEHLLEDLPSVPAEPLEERSAPPVPLRESIRLEGVTFCYPTAKAPLFSGLDLEIRAGTSVGFVGATGSGKSTLVDLVLGLLRPDQGRIVVDGVALTDENVRGWQRTIGYVPQAIFLANDTVARNIAFGLPDEEIDFGAVVRAAEAAAIDSFVEHELPEGYSTVVGERGVRLSGGQRQRIGIARALYRDPQVIVFDEATSSLDTVTEEVILQSIAGLARTRTILAVAHRLSTVRSCDRILFLEAGKIVATGTYDQLLTSSPGFRALAGAAVEK
jgi:ABC-type multidrug transport system fused ATPase/permease subunit